MAEDPSKPPGTSEPTDGEALDAQTRTAATEDREEAGERKPHDWKAEALQHRGKVEQINRVERENAELRAELERRGKQPATDAASQVQDEIDDLEVDNRALEEENTRLAAIADVDPVARALITANKATIRANRRSVEAQRNTVDAFTLSEVPADKRGSLMSFYNRNREHFGSLAAAKQAFERRDLAEENAVLKKRIEDMEKGRTEPDRNGARDDDVRTTASRDLSTPTHKARTMTREDFDAKVAELHAQGRSREARDLGMELRSGKIVLRR